MTNFPNPNQLLRITFNRPSLRTDLKCWLLNISIVNLSQEEIQIERIFFDAESEATEFTNVADARFPLAQKITEQIHQLFSLPLLIKKGESKIGVIAMPLTNSAQFATPYNNTCIAHTNRGNFTYPLFRMQF